METYERRRTKRREERQRAREQEKTNPYVRTTKKRKKEEKLRLVFFGHLLTTSKLWTRSSLRKNVMEKRRHISLKMILSID